MATFLRAKDVIKKVAIAKTQLNERIAAGTFPPASARLGRKSKVWLDSVIDAWMLEEVDKERAKQRAERRAKQPGNGTAKQLAAGSE